MPTQKTYTQARANIAKLCDQVTSNRDIVVINRRGHEDVALIAAAELSSLMETAHLLRSPRNAARLLTALNRALASEGTPRTIHELLMDSGLEKET